MSKIANIVAEASKLSPEAQRKVGSIIGAVVGDAACLHLEWVYDQAKVTKIVPEGQDPAFWSENHNPFFNMPNGHFSCYADEAVQSLTAMAENDGKFDEGKTITKFLHHFGDPDSPYQVALAKRKDKKYPIDGPWIQGAMISMMDRYKADIKPPGDEDAKEHDGLVTALPLIVQQGFNPDLEGLKKAFQIMTQEPDAILHHQAEAFLISQFIQGNADPVKATKEKFSQNDVIVKEITAVEEGKAAGESARDLVKKFGMACPMPGSFQSSLVSIIGAANYPDAIRETMLCGGDSCSRANMIGACLGAKFGIQGIPSEWMEKVNGMEAIIANSVKCFTK